LFASSNTANLEPGKFIQSIEQSIAKAGRKILQRHYVPQPLDFRIAREEPAYLKTIWLRIG
jgi:23S rRNA G2069 N7-methylase RlmK/C1962 C5-methylase RlmI